MLAMSAQVVSCCVYDKTKVNIPYMDGNIPHLFLFWADPFVHLLLLKSSMPQLMKMFSFSYSFAKRKSVFVNVATTTAAKRQKVHHLPTHCGRMLQLLLLLLLLQRAHY